MTKDTPTALYVAGPMRGFDKWNFPAFRSACAYLRDIGYRVISPHELDEAIGFTEDTETLPDGFMHGAMRRDLEALLEVKGVVVLPGWEQSTGTRFELSVAEMLGLHVYTYDPDGAFGNRLGVLSWSAVHRRIEAADSVPLEVGYLEASADEATMAPLPPIVGLGGVPIGKASANAYTTTAENPKDRIGIRKPRLSLVPKSFIIRVAQAMTDGARKYGPFNWRTKRVKATVYVDALERHVAAWFDGEELASDSGLLHLAHAGACIGILIDALETGNLDDDRPTAGAAGRLIAELTEAP